MTAYRDVVSRLLAETSARGWSQRQFAAAAGVSQSAASKALSGSSWPRWPTLTALVAALDLQLAIDGEAGDPVAVLVGLLDSEDEFTGRSVAAEVGFRPNTLYDLRKPGRAPSAATVFALAAWFDVTPTVE